MGSKNTHRFVELIKTLLIVALAITAVALVGRIQLYSPLPAASKWLDSIVHLFHDADTAPGSQSGQAGLSTGLRPVCLAVCNEDGRYGVQYDSETLGSALETQLGGLLGEALADAGNAYPVTQDEWREALSMQDASVYYDFLGSVPLSALSVWLGGEQNSALTGDARRLLLAPGSGTSALLYYTTGSEGPYYACTTTVETDSRLRPVTADYTPNNAVFAFQQEDRYPKLGPYVMILPDPPSPSVYQASNPIGTAGTDVMDTLLRNLDFHPQTSAVYEAADGKRVREGTDMLLISGDGTVSFHASVSQDPRYPVTSAGAAPSRGELVEAARALVEHGLGVWCGDAGFYLIGTETGPDGLVTVYFGYLLNGAAVELGEDSYAARVVLKDAYISDFTLRFRTYQKMETISAVMPEIQAAAAMNAIRPKGNELLLCYLDGGGSQVTAGWVAR